MIVRKKNLNRLIEDKENEFIKVLTGVRKSSK